MRQPTVEGPVTELPRVPLRKYILGAVPLFALLCFLPGMAAAQAPRPAAAKPDPRIEVARNIPDTRPEDLRATPIPGIYELTNDGEIAYVTSDGRFAISGDLYDLKGNVNLTDARRRELRVALLSQVPDADTLVFAPKVTKHTINVFTDVDCGYCRKMHSEIAEYNKLGIKVRYLFFPRTGPDTESWAKAESVWCSPNRNEALTRAKRGEGVKSPKCSPTPVARDFEIGEKIGLRGTPAIVLASGELLPGYVPPAMLLEHLKTASR